MINSDEYLTSLCTYIAEVLTQLEGQGFEKPSPIQAQMWPIALQGHDVVGIAQVFDSLHIFAAVIWRY